MEMTNVILDSNIYGEIAKDLDGDVLVEKIVRDNKFAIHDYKVVRVEMREAPNILKIYNRLVKTGILEDLPIYGKIAKEYHDEYKKRGGTKKLKRILKDFKIVAFASHKNCDLIFSNDEKTMKHKHARTAYERINLKHRIRTPTFYTYKDLKKTYLSN